MPAPVTAPATNQDHHIERLRGLLEDITAELLDGDEKVEVTATTVASRVVFTIWTENYARICGRHGVTANALRTLFEKFTGKYKLAMTIDIERMDDRPVAARPAA